MWSSWRIIVPSLPLLACLIPRAQLFLKISICPWILQILAWGFGRCPFLLDQLGEVREHTLINQCMRLWGDPKVSPAVRVCKVLPKPTEHILVPCMPLKASKKLGFLWISRAGKLSAKQCQHCLNTSSSTPDITASPHFFLKDDLEVIFTEDTQKEWSIAIAEPSQV